MISPISSSKVPEWLRSILRAVFCVNDQATFPRRYQAGNSFVANRCLSRKGAVTFAGPTSPKSIYSIVQKNDFEAWFFQFRTGGAQGAGLDTSSPIRCVSGTCSKSLSLDLRTLGFSCRINSYPFDRSPIRLCQPVGVSQFSRRNSEKSIRTGCTEQKIADKISLVNVISRSSYPSQDYLLSNPILSVMAFLKVKIDPLLK